MGDSYRKVLKKQWVLTYEKIFIIDDFPQVWETKEMAIHWIVPSEFRGAAMDQGLLETMKQLTAYLRQLKL